jgi:uncharacterized membrane protein
VGLPRRISREARARRELLFDAIAATVLAAILLTSAAGLGVIGFFALPVLALGLAWIGAERGISRMRHRR